MSKDLGAHATVDKENRMPGQRTGQGSSTGEVICVATE